MNHLKLFLFLALLPFPGISGEGDFRLVAYRPAPGQFINIENTGTPQAAQQVSSDPATLVSLGGFGGYAVFAFDEPCVNDPDNPYGIDFTLFGNAFAGSSEPGVVWVMKDENGNGEPDDTWYEIAGSHHFHSGTISGDTVTYFKTATRDVFWRATGGPTGWIRANDFNEQPYYPASSYFPDYPPDSVTFSGTRLDVFIDSTDAEAIKIRPPAFGYADCRPRNKSAPTEQPDNPYTAEIEGAGGDPVDLSWAVDPEGNYVDLDSVHFVKIVSSSLQQARHLGELSTEIAWLADVAPTGPVSGKAELLVVYPHRERILAGDSLQLEACYFENGRNTGVAPLFSPADPSVAQVSATGKVTARTAGEARIMVTAGEESLETVVNVVVPDSMAITSDFAAVYPGDSVALSAAVWDQENHPLEVPLRWSSSDPATGEVISSGGTPWFRALSPGETWLTCTATGFSAEASVRVKVLSEADKMKVYFSMKTASENIFPFQWVEVEMANLNTVVEERQKDYAGLDRMTLFHALAAGLEKAVAGFRFKDDAATNGKLYLYQVEQQDGGTSAYTYGWGGKTEPADFAMAWIARLNNHSYINGFDEVEIAGGDTVDLYHVSGITAPWDYQRLLADTDSAASGEEVELRVEATTCSWNGTAITETGLSPVEQQEVLATESYYTGAGGRVRVTPAELPVVFYAGSAAVLIASRTVTETSGFPAVRYRIWPNPAREKLVVEGASVCGARAIVRSMTGKTVLSRRAAGNRLVLDVGSLPPGMYHLILLSGERTTTAKFVKQ